MAIVKTPVYVELDQRRELVFDLNTEALIQGAGKRDASLWAKIGEVKDEKTGELCDKLDVNVENLRLYLWACLYRDMKDRGELLTVEDVGALIDNRKKATAAFIAVRASMNSYYGRDDEKPGKK